VSEDGTFVVNNPAAGNFVPANEVEEILVDAIRYQDTDTYIKAVLLGEVWVPIGDEVPDGVAPGDPAFRWQANHVAGTPVITVFTSTWRAVDHFGDRGVRAVRTTLAQVLKAWPDPAWGLVLNPGSPIGASIPGEEVAALYEWALEAGLAVEDTFLDEKAASPDTQRADSGTEPDSPGPDADSQAVSEDTPVPPQGEAAPESDATGGSEPVPADAVDSTTPAAPGGSEPAPEPVVTLDAETVAASAAPAATDPVGTTESAEPDSSAGLVEAVEQVESAESVEVAEAVAPAEPTESTESTESAESMESAEAAGPAEPAEVTESAELSSPAGPVEAVEQVESAESVEVAEAVAPAEPTESTEPAESTEAAGTVEPAGAAEPAEPAGSTATPMMTPEEAETAAPEEPHGPLEALRQSVEETGEAGTEESVQISQEAVNAEAQKAPAEPTGPVVVASAPVRVPQQAAPGQAPEPAYSVMMMEKVLSPAHLSFYLERGYDRISGFVYRADHLASLGTVARIRATLGLDHPRHGFPPGDGRLYVLRWPGYVPGLYRVAYGGTDEATMRATGGWVIEAPPFRGDGRPPGASVTGALGVIEYKTEGVRVPHGAEIHRVEPDGTRTVVALYDADTQTWHRLA